MADKNLAKIVFPPGGKIIIEYIDHEKASMSCATTIEDVEDNYLVLKEPVAGEEPVVFRESQELTLKRLDDQAQTAYVTNVFVIDIRQGETPLVVCSKPYKVKSTSLRRFSRFGANLPLLYSGIDTSGGGRLSDLSLSGCCAILKPNPKLKPGLRLLLSFDLPGAAEVRTKAKVVRVTSLKARDDLSVAFEFIDLDEAAADLLYNYIFQLQLIADSILGTSPKGQ